MSNFWKENIYGNYFAHNFNFLSKNYGIIGVIVYGHVINIYMGWMGKSIACLGNNYIQVLVFHILILYLSINILTQFVFYFISL